MTTAGAFCAISLNTSIALPDFSYGIGGGHWISSGVNWSDPADEDLRDQITTELFYRFQFSENIAITPSVQWLVDPANNTDGDQIRIAGLV